MRKKLAKYPQTIVVVLLLAMWAVIIGVTMLWHPFFYIAMAGLVVFLLVSALKSDRKKAQGS